jgi:hypothetical protein
MIGLIQAVELAETEGHGQLTVNYPDNTGADPVGTNQAYAVNPSTAISGGYALNELQAGWGVDVVAEGSLAISITVYPN